MRSRKITIYCSFITALASGFWAADTSAVYYPELLYRYDHHLFAIDPNAHPSWRRTEEVWKYRGRDIIPPQRLRIDGDDLPGLPEGFTRSLNTRWDRAAIAKTLEEQIASALDRPRGTVTIAKDEEGNITFEGVGFLGKEVDTYIAAALTIDALESGVYDIHIPVIEEQPRIHVFDPNLRDLGIAEVVGIGESNFARSPLSRRHNIKIGLHKFNGHLIPQGEIFSFNETLGPVTDATGYKKELVILGDKTLPDYGGGLCQVSTTAYRGIWEYGFPITQRRNHSFSVQYYAPQGTDATIYPPYTDVKFLNDGPSAVLIQTYTEGDLAYFIYYGTRDQRETEVVGPFVWDRKEPPPDRTEYTDEIAPGETRIVGKATPGLQAVWFRISKAEPQMDEVIEPVYSYYEARPNFTQYGQDAKRPSWLGTVQ